MEEAEAFREASKLYKEFGEVGNIIRDLGKKHRESVKVSLSALEIQKSKLLERELQFIPSYMTKDDKKYDLNYLYSLLNKTRRNLQLLKLLSMSEITHRKVSQLKFRTTNLFLFRESRSTLRKIKIDLDYVDEKSTPESKGKDIEDCMENYDRLIREANSLEEAIQEDRRSGIGKYLMLILTSVSGWIGLLLAITSGEAQSIFRDVTFYILVGISVILIALFLLMWNYLSYGFRYMKSNRGLFAESLGFVFLVGGPPLLFSYEISKTVEITKIFHSICISMLFFLFICLINSKNQVNLLLANEIKKTSQIFSKKII